MSTGADCHFDEVEPGRWTYWLQAWPYGDNPDGETYGPFGSFRTAHEHLNQNHGNPGGYAVGPLTDGRHVHEWSPGGYVEVGVTLSIDVASLGPRPDKADVVRLVQSLPVDHPAFKTYSMGSRWSEKVRSCESCGAQRED